MRDRRLCYLCPAIRFIRALLQLERAIECHGTLIDLEREEIVPESFNFVALLETLDERAIRIELVDRLRNSLSNWIGVPLKVFFLGSQDSQLETWAGATSLKARRLSDAEHLFTYFATRDSTQDQYVVLGVRQSSQAAVYNLSFPTLAMAAELDAALDVLCRMYQEISAMKIRSVVAAGAELEIDAASVEDVIRSTREVGSLVSLVCCESKDAGELCGFVSLGESRGGVAFKRNEVLA